MSGYTALNHQSQDVTKCHCRFCATEMNFHELLDLSTKDTLIKYTKIIEFLNLNVDLSENTKLPRYTCFLCHNKCLESYNFFLKVKQSQDKLSSLYEDIKKDISANDDVDEETVKDKIKSETEENSPNEIHEIANESFSITYAGIPLYNNEIKTDDIPENIENESDDDNISLQSECEVYLDEITNLNVENNETINQNALEMQESWLAVETNNIAFDKSKDSDLDYGKTTLAGPKEISINELELDDHNNKHDAKDKNKSDCITVDSCKDAELSNKESELEHCVGNAENIEISDTESEFDENSNTPITYAGMPIFIDEDIENNEQITVSEVTKTRQSHNSDSDDDDIVKIISKVDDKSWASYPWSCDHCKADCESMEDVRAHSRYMHHYCYGFRCVDCNDDFNRFSSFVEHVRMHREYLRLFCQYCNKNFQDKKECFDHSLTHWSAQKICEHCGETFPDRKALIAHQKQSWKKRLKRSTLCKKPKLVFPAKFVYSNFNVFEDEVDLGSWKDYEWSCLDCYKVLPDIQSLRNHVQEIHSKCFAMKCSDCLMVTNSFHMFVKHVHEHRPHLRNYCQYCNEYYENLDEMTTHIESHFTSTQKPCFGCGQTFQNNDILRQHMNNLNAPRKPGSTTAEDTTCDICQKTFKCVSIMRNHKLSHNKKDKKFICHICGKGFHSQGDLSGHLNSHREKNETCKICQRKFKSKHRLKNHAKLHLELRPYICDHCGTSFKRNALIRHLKSLTEVKRHTCKVCKKDFRSSGNLKVHFNQHLGVTFSCKFCEKVFNNASNMNKHMIRIHGTSHFKSKVSIETIAMDKKEMEWLSKVTTRQSRKKT